MEKNYYRTIIILIVTMWVLFGFATLTDKQRVLNQTQEVMGVESPRPQYYEGDSPLQLVDTTNYHGETVLVYTYTSDRLPGTLLVPTNGEDPVDLYGTQTYVTQGFTIFYKRGDGLKGLEIICNLPDFAMPTVL